MLEKIDYNQLNSRQKENYNYHKVTALLVEYGYTTCLRMSDDYLHADFVAVNISGEVLKIQLKARLTFDLKYFGKDIHICFPHQDNFYLYNHDLLLEQNREIISLDSTGLFHKGRLTLKYLSMLEKYKL